MRKKKKLLKKLSLGSWFVTNPVTRVSFKILSTHISSILSILLGFSFSSKKREDRGSSSMDTCMIPIPNALTKKFWRLLREILSFSFTQGADTPLQITRDGFNTRRHSGKNSDPSRRDNHSGPGRGHTQEPRSWAS